MFTKTTLALLPLSFAACANTPSLQESENTPWRIEIFAEDAELNEVEFTDPGFAELTLKDESRKRTGIEASYGNDTVRGVVRIYEDDLLDDAAGVAFGVEGQPNLTTLDWGKEGVDVLLQYGFTLGFTGSADVTVGGSTGEMAYIEAVSELGLALDMHNNLVPSIGLVNQSFEGAVDFDGETDHDWGDDDVSGDYTRGYIGLDYAIEGAGANVGVRGLFGDSNSIGVTLSWSF